MSVFIPVWAMISGVGVAGWVFGYRIVGALAFLGGLVYGGFINF